MKTAEHQILTRIGFAERWLQRARRECLDGDVGRGLLTLVLADAEVRRVLHLAARPAPRSPSYLLPAVAVCAGLVIAAAVALQVTVLGLGAVPAESGGLSPGLVLRPGTGVLREMIEAVGPQSPAQAAEAPTAPPPPVPAKRRPDRSRAVSSAAPPPPAPLPVVLVAPPVSAPAPVAVPQRIPAPVPAVTPAPAPAAALSGVDLLDLLIVADRTLRRSQP